MRTVGLQEVQYIEKAENNFAEIKKGLIPWASIYCHHEINTPMVIVQRDNSVFLPTTLILPNYIERALYLMNLGLPESRKVFICGSSNDTYFSLMNQYKLHNEERCKVLAYKLTGFNTFSASNLARNCIQTGYKMDFYKSNLNGGKSREIYMVLRDNDAVLAIAHKHMVFLNCQRKFYRLDSKSINAAMTFLIQEKWNFATDKKSIGYSRECGENFEPVFNLIDETIEMPDLSNSSKFSNETIQII